MPKGKVVTVDSVLAPLFRFLDRRSPDARTMVAGMVQKEVARLNARPKAKAPGKKVKAVPPTPVPAASNFERAAGAKAPKPQAKKSHKKKAQAAAKPNGGGENTAGEAPVS